MHEDLQREEHVQELLALLQKDKTLRDFRGAFTAPEDLVEFANRAQFALHDQGEQVIKQGDRGDNFFIVLNGQLRAIDVSNKKPRLLGYFSSGAIVGERAMLHDRIRTATVEVVVGATLAWFSEEDWYWLIGRNSRFEDFFHNMEAYRIQQSAMDFPGRQYDEVVVASTKRHFTAFLAELTYPILLLIAPIVIILIAQFFGLALSTILADAVTLLATLPFFIAAILLALYNYFDWLNDDFIVTTKRVVHIERILFFGEQRKDAPLTRIQDVTVISDILDLIFDSDTLRIATAGAGTIVFNHIRHAEHIRQVIFAERVHAKARVAAADVVALRHTIANQIHVTEGLKEHVMDVAEPEGLIVHQPTTRHYNRFIDYFIPRIKEVSQTPEGTIITWRKHYYVLITNIVPPLLALSAAVYLFIASFFLWLPPFMILAWPIQATLGIIILACMLWYLIKYDDWNKDVYIVTNTQIIDIESAAFRVRKTKREGTFDNIQGVYSEIPNLFYKLLNLGDVIIETAGSDLTFTFEKVFNPAAVTEEIFSRWAIYQQKERESQRDATNRQVMDVLKEYHKLVSNDVQQ